MSFRAGHKCKVTIGSDTIVGMGTWRLEGITADQMETSAFGNNWKTYEFGMKDGGTLTFSGFEDPDDTTGQMVLKKCNVDNSDIYNLRLYVDNTSYYEPCATTGYFAPGALSTGQDTLKSWVNITSYNVSADKSGMLAVEFTAKISGCMVLI